MTEHPTSGGVTYVYIVRCADDTLYTGWTVDLQRRVREHNAGRGARYTTAGSERLRTIRDLDVLRIVAQDVQQLLRNAQLNRV